ncbi:class I SAM-dependent methyltransferase [Priestia megaterium]|uniref:class I SAM-dependent methyltransferase n=1 Tax=Priestia megaterium TaxID=1404 RepID=UPI003A87A44A
MGHLIEKYNEKYFLGGKNTLTNNDYGLLGYKEFKHNKVHPRFIETFKFIKSFIQDFRYKEVLEVGFGRGELIPFFLKENIQSYHGIDFSNTAFKIAQKHYSHPKVTLEIKEAKDLNKKNSYDVIVLNHVIEYIPVFEMEVVWRKIKNMLRPGGVIIIGNSLYDNPNEADDTDNIHETMGMNCNKQTKGTLLRSCLGHDFILAKVESQHIGLISKKDLSIFSKSKKNSFLSTHNKELSKLGFYNQTNFSKDDLKKLVPDAGRVVIGCVTENNAKFREQTLKLVQSIRWFGGSMAGVNIIVCVVEDVDSAFVKELGKWGAFVRIVKRFSTEHAPSNKLRFLELSETASYDTVMLMDCDTVIVQDPLKYIKGDRFQAAMAGMATVSHKTFEKLFSHYNLPMPEKEFKTSFKGNQMIWYCNAGVLIFPQEILPSFLSTWKKYVHDLVANKHLLKKFFFCEQAALTLAYYAEDIPFEELPKEMNYHLNPKILYTGKKVDPIIIHYHDYINNKGYLLKKTKDIHLLRMIQKFNKRLKNYRSELTSDLS